MKKVILSVVLILGIGMAANAHIQNRDHIQQDQKNSIDTTATERWFKR